MVERNDLVAFLLSVSARFEKLCTSYNPTGKLARQSWDTPLGRLDVIISRGEVFEKAGSIYCDLEIETPPVLAEKLGQRGSTAEAFVLEINCYPVNPFIPRGYMELRANITDRVVLAGGTDIFPYFSHEGDVSFFAEGMKQLCGRHGQDYEKLRKTRADFFMSKYRKEKVGAHAGIYSFHLEDNHFDFFKEMAEAFFTLYTGIVEKRKGKPFTDEEKKLMKKIHGVWAQWVLLEDEGTKYGLEKGIPPDALLGAILPPNATF